ncbi:DUF6252 family protein [Mucilaginibacter sp. AW1-3]
MKKAGTLFCFLSLYILLFSSCQKIPGHTTGATPAVTATGNISLKVDGTSMSSTLSIATLYVSTNTIQIIGQLPGTQGINLMVDNVKTGTFDIVIDNPILSYSTTAAYSDTFLGTAGTITITTFTSDTIAGTFQFTGTNYTTNTVKSITSGVFNLKYIKI